jgi:ribosomal protein L22
MPEDEKTVRSGAQAEEGKGSRKPARGKTAKEGAGARKGKARKPAATKEKSESAKPKAKAADSETGGKSEPKPKPAPKRKALQETALPPPVVRASARYVRIAPRKARLVADQVRGMHIDEARALLQFSPRGAARNISRLIDSAAANAENNHELVADDMKIMEINVDEGPTLRRFRPRALGRATRINKRTSHISVALTPEDDA